MLFPKNAVLIEYDDKSFTQLCARAERLVGRNNVTITLLDALNRMFGIAFEVSDGRISAVVDR